MSVDAVIDRLRRELLVSLGLLLPITSACTSEKADDAAGVTTDPSGDADEGEDSGDTGSTDEGDMPPPGTCALTYLGPSDLSAYPSCELSPLAADGCPNLFYLACVAGTPGQTCDQQCPSGSCEPCTGDEVLLDAFGSCGPFEIDGQCCSVHGFDDNCGSGPIDAFGRPFVVGGVARVAALAAEHDDAAPAPPVELTPELRRQLGLHWARSAMAEHASIASFARFGQQLLGLGAPAALVRDTCTAALDEVRHAEGALAMASRLAGIPFVFGPLDIADSDEEDTSPLERMVLACIHEGCVGETMAALYLAAAANRCAAPELATLLRSISADEARHASLAWRTVQWAIRRDPSLVPKVLAAFEVAMRCPPRVSSLHAREREQLAAHGCLVGAELDELHRAGVERLLRPCVAAIAPVAARI